MKKIILITLLSFATIYSYGQGARLIHGCVFGKDRLPLQGAIISDMQGKQICVSNASGLFSATTIINVVKIQISCDGYNSQTIDVDGSYLIVNLNKRSSKSEKEKALIAAQKEAEEKAKNEEKALIAAQKKAEEKAKNEEKARIAAQKKIEANEKKIARKEKLENRTLAPIKKGYEQEVSFAWSYMFSPDTYNGDDSIPLCVNYIGGYRFNHYFFVGVGTGIDIDCHSRDYFAMDKRFYVSYDIDYEYYPYFANTGIRSRFLSSSQKVSVPLYAHFKTYFMKTKWAPFFAFSGGVRFSAPKELMVYEPVEFFDEDLATKGYRFGDYIRTDTFGGVTGMFETMLGVSYRHSKKFGFNFQFGYATRSGLYEWTNWHNDKNAGWREEEYRVRKWDEWLHGFTLRFGVVF